MTNTGLLFIFLAVFFAQAACKSSALPGNSAVNTNSASNSANVAVAAPQISNGAVPANGAVESPANQGLSEKFDDLRKNGATGQTGAQQNAATRPAPDNSVFSSTLTDIGRETRTFRDHPQLLKAEKLITPKLTVVKIYLRGGRVIDVAGDKIPNMFTASAADILSAAGVPQQQSRTAPASADDTKAKSAKQ